MLSLLAFRLASSYMVRQRERSAVAQTMLNARLVEQAMTADDGDLRALLTGLSSDLESATLLITDGQVISTSNVSMPSSCRRRSSARSRAVRPCGDLATGLPEDDPDLAPLAVAFNETAERLEARVRRDVRFAGDVSHELRSPLMTMANAVAILERRREDLSPGSVRALDLLSLASRGSSRWSMTSWRSRRPATIRAIATSRS